MGRARAVIASGGVGLNSLVLLDASQPLRQITQAQVFPEHPVTLVSWRGALPSRQPLLGH